MEKEEETTRELLLPNWQGSGSHGLTITQRDDGVFVQEVMQNSPAARTGVVKEGESSWGAGWCWGSREGAGVAGGGEGRVRAAQAGAWLWSAWSQVTSGWSVPKPCPPLPTLCRLFIHSPHGRRSRGLEMLCVLCSDSTTQEFGCFGPISCPSCLSFLISTMGVNHTCESVQGPSAKCWVMGRFPETLGGLTHILLFPAQGTRLWVPPSTLTTCSRVR